MYHILFIKPGPVFAIDSARYNELSKRFGGAIITSSPTKECLQTHQVGTFDFYCHSFERDRRFRSTVLFFLRTILLSIKWRFGGRKFDLVVTYDPLKTGFIGAVCSLILGCRFAPEVNGVYTSPAVYLDDGARLITKIKQKFYPLLEALVLWRADGVKFLFPEQGKPFQRILKGKVIHWFANRINLEAFLKEEVHDPGNEILFVGFPFYLKGVDILIRAFKSIAEEFPGWHLKILGWYPDTTYLYDAIDGHPQIVFHPPVMHDEMPRHMRECSIFVLPSRSEAMGRVLVEAMASGKARIGACVDGIPTVIKDGEDGLLFRAEDSGDLADKLRILMMDTGLRQRLGAAGRERAKMEFCTNVYYEKLLDFYQRVITGQNG